MAQSLAEGSHSVQRQVRLECPINLIGACRVKAAESLPALLEAIRQGMSLVTHIALCTDLRIDWARFTLVLGRNAIGVTYVGK